LEDGYHGSSLSLNKDGPEVIGTSGGRPYNPLNMCCDETYFVLVVKRSFIDMHSATVLGPSLHCIETILLKTMAFEGECFLDNFQLIFRRNLPDRELRLNLGLI
jgi:hypothetical protein